MKAKIINFLIRLMVQAIFIIFSITILFALYYLIINALKSEPEFYQSQFALPSKIDINRIKDVWVDGNIGRAFKNSLIMGSSTVLIVIPIGALAGYAFSNFKFKHNTLLYMSVISTMYFSPMILIIPIFLIYSKIMLVNTYIGTIIIYSGINLAFGIFLLTTFFRGIPDEIIEAATIDGASRFQILKSIIIPLSTPAIFTLGLMVFYNVWNDLIIGVIFMQKPEYKPIMAAISQFRGKWDSNNTAIFLGALIATIPIMLIYGFAQKYFIRGMTLGSIK